MTRTRQRRARAPRRWNRQLEAIVRLARQPARSLACRIGGIQPAQRQQHFGAAPLDLDDQVTFGGHPLGEPQRFVIRGQRLFVAAAIEVQLGEEFARQHFLAQRPSFMSLHPGLRQQPLGFLETAFESRHVAQANRDVDRAQFIADLRRDPLRLGEVLCRLLPVTALLEDDAQVDERGQRLTKMAAALMDLECLLMVRGGGIPFAEILVNQPKIVTNVRRAGVVTDTAVQREGLLVKIPRLGRITPPVREPPQQVERGRRWSQLARGIGELESPARRNQPLIDTPEPEQGIPTLEVKLAAQREWLNHGLLGEKFASLSQGALGVSLQQATGNALDPQPDAPLHRQRPGFRARQEALDDLQRRADMVGLQVEIRQHFQVRESRITFAASNGRDLLFQPGNTMYVEAGHVDSPDNELLVRCSQDS